MTPNELRALELLHQLEALSPDDGEVAARLTVRAGDGRLVGDVTLSSRDVEALTDGVRSIGDYARAMREDGPSPFVPASVPDAVAELDPAARAELEAHFDAIPAELLADDVMKAGDQDAATRAFEWLVLGETPRRESCVYRLEWDPQILGWALSYDGQRWATVNANLPGRPEMDHRAAQAWADGLLGPQQWETVHPGEIYRAVPADPTDTAGGGDGVR